MTASRMYDSGERRRQCVRRVRARVYIHNGRPELLDGLLFCPETQMRTDFLIFPLWARKAVGSPYFAIRERLLNEKCLKRNRTMTDLLTAVPIASASAMLASKGHKARLYVLGDE